MSLNKSGNRGPGKMLNSLKEDLLRWMCEKHATNHKIDRRRLREKALELTKIYELQSFKCSDGWLTNFLKEHGFSLNLINAGPTFDDYHLWIDLMRPTITRYRHNDLFHVDELTMYSDIVPTKISADEEEESRKNRVTVLMCSNSSGTTKLPLLICGSYSSKLTKKDHVYCHSQDARIGEDLFRDWLSFLNVDMARCNRKILLLLRRSRADSLKNLSLSNVELIFFPADFPPRLQPLRRDVFHYVKMIYRRRYAEQLRRYGDWNVQNVVETLIDSWEQVPCEVIILSFQRTQFRTDDCYLQIECDSWKDLNTGISFRRFVTFDDALSDEPKHFEEGRRHSYNLRTNRRDARLNDSSIDDDRQNIAEMSESGKSNEDYPDGKNHSDQRPQRAPITVHDKGHYGVSIRLGGNETERSSIDRRRYGAWENDRLGVANIESDSSKGQDAGPLRSVEEPAKLARCNPDSVQAIVDKALTLTSAAKTAYARKLIDNVFACNVEARRKNVAGEESVVTSTHSSDGKTVLTDGLDEPSTSTSYRRSLKEDSSFKRSEDRAKATARSDAPRLQSASTGGGGSQKSNRSTKSRTRRWKSLDLNGSEDESSDGEPAEKRSKTDRDWSKRYETTFVFGPLNGSGSMSERSSRNSCRSSERSRKKIKAGETEEPGVFGIRPSVSPKD